MPKREKRLLKGIESLEEQKKIHQEKRKIAQELGDDDLINYYDKEITKFERQTEKKKSQLNR